jgi:SPP1 gp7 family putative phage head morphogenesis protein
MCNTCINRKLTVNEVLQLDPTRTLSTRKRFVAQMVKRFGQLKGAINKFIIVDDGLLTSDFDTLLNLNIRVNETPAEWRSKYDANKIPRFMEWLERQNEKFILSKGKSGIELIGQVPPFFAGQASGIEGTLSGLGDELSERAISTNWTDVHIRSAYQKGVTRAQQELNKAGANVPLFQNTTEGLGGVFNAPFHADRARLAFTKTFEGLKGITKAMDAGISSVLAQGMAEGRSPREIARNINNRVDKIGLTRAKTLARTEVVSAHHQANINEYERAGIEGVKVKAEWSTAGFNVCPICQGNEGRIFTLDEIRGLIPAHPNCRCVALPIVPQTRIERIRERRGGKPAKRRGKTGGYIPAEIRTENEIGKFFKGISKEDRTGSSFFADEMLGKIVKDQKFDGLPQKISRSEFNRLKKNNTVMYRGVTEVKYKEQFTRGSYFPGTGVHGNGSYFTSKFDEAKAYGVNKNSNVVSAIVDKRAKGIARNDVTDIIVKFDDKLSEDITKVFADVKSGELTESAGETLLNQLSLNREIMQDEGRMAAMLGYDFITVEAEANHLIILNRTALRVVEETANVVR